MNRNDSVPELTEVDINKIVDLPDGVPRLNTFYLYMTTGCNLFCQHCWITPAFVNGKPSPGQFIQFDQLMHAVTEGKTLGLTSIKFTGGEPLLHPQFREILDHLTSENLNLTMETNATLIDSDLAEYMKNHSSLWFISTSLDSHRPEYHDQFRGVKGTFQKTIRGIKHLVNVGYKPQIIMSVHKGNVNDVEDVIKLAVSLGAGSVKFNPVTPNGRGEKMARDGKTLDYKEHMNLVRFIRGEMINKYPVDLHISIPPALATIKELLDHRNFTGECNVRGILGILGSGEMALCGIGRNIPELCFGKLGEDSVRDVWINHPTLKKLREDLSGDYPGLCGDCIHSHMCQTECVAINYTLSGKLVNPFYLCLEAEERNEFPVTRRRSFKKET